MADAAEIHHALIQRLTGEGGPLSPASPNATVNSRDRFLAPGIPTRPRRQLHARIIEEFFAENPDVARDRLAIISVGPPGAGKSSAMKQLIPEHEQMLWRQIDPDEFKQRILHAEISDGTLVTLMPGGVEQLPPGELAALVHEESSFLAAQARDLALARGERVVLDGVHGHVSKIEARLAQLAGAGYGARSTNIVTVDGSWVITRARVEHRWRTSYVAYIAGEHDGTTTRFVPEAVTDELYADRTATTSTCRVATRDAMRGERARFLVERALVFEVPAATAAPTLSTTYEVAADGRVRMKRASIPTATTPGSGSTSVPPASQSGETLVWVEGYTRGDGAHVEGHFRKPRGATT